MPLSQYRCLLRKEMQYEHNSGIEISLVTVIIHNSEFSSIQTFGISQSKESVVWRFFKLFQLLNADLSIMVI